MSVNQSLRPITTERKGNLYIGGCDLVELAQKYGTPLYVIDEESLRQICREYIDAFKIYPNIKMMYASKALCNLAIASILSEEGFGFDTVSAGEFYTVNKAGVNMETVLFNGNNKTEKEISLAIDLGVGRFSIDNFYEAELLNKIANEKNKIRLFEELENKQNIAIIVGSEGGFSDNEINQIYNAGAKNFGLGDRILRAETAVIAMASIVGYACGV